MAASGRSKSMSTALTPRSRNARKSATMSAEVPVVAADRIPGVAQSRGAAQCRRAFAADPYWRMRLLHGLGFEDDTVELGPIAVEPRRLFGPELAKRPQIFVGHGTAGGKRGRHRSVELCLEPAGADADEEASAGEDVD